LAGLWTGPSIFTGTNSISFGVSPGVSAGGLLLDRGAKHDTQTHAAAVVSRHLVFILSGLLQ
jgi:hypothetical protein